MICKTGQPNKWSKGTVLKTTPSELLPYEILLENGTSIHASFDRNDVIREFTGEIPQSRKHIFHSTGLMKAREFRLRSKDLLKTHLNQNLRLQLIMGFHCPTEHYFSFLTPLLSQFYQEKVVSQK